MFLQNRGWQVLPSKTNFVLAAKEGLAGDEIYRRIKRQGVLVRHFAGCGVENFVRMTIGNPQQVESLKKAIVTLDD